MTDAVAEPPDLSAWDNWFDPAKTSISEAFEVFRIVTDVDIDEDSDETTVPDVPFILRLRQAEALDTIENYFWKLKRRAARLVVLKARRYGFTTFFLLLGLVMILRVPGYQVLLVAQDDSMAEQHFQRLRDALKQIPEDVLKARGITIIQDTKHQVVLRHGDSKTSAFRVAPAKRNALGRGGQYNMLLLTENPHWPASAKRALMGLLRSCRNVRGNLIVFESTANGFDDFQRRYARAENGSSDYRAMFVACYEHPGNRKKFKSAAEEEAFTATIGKLREFGAEDELVLFRKLTVDLRWAPKDVAEFLNWRRATLVDDCEGSLDNLHQEEPNTPTEAFTGTGIPIFNKAMLEAWRPYAEAREKKGQRGSLLVVRDKFTFSPEIRADLVILEMPEEGLRYAAGTDVASGIAVLADGRTEADFGYTCIKETTTKRTVARLRAHIGPRELAEMTFRLLCWYNAASFKKDTFRCVFIERAINDSGVCIDRFEDLELGDVRGDELLLGETRLIKTDDANVKANWKWTPGFKTTQKSKPKLAENIKAEILAAGMPDGVKPCPFDIQFLDEGMRFERSEISGRMEAATGHDDGVVAEGLALEACDEVEKDFRETEPPPPSSTSPHMKLLKYARMAEEQRLTEAEGEVSAVPGMPGF